MIEGSYESWRSLLSFVDTTGNLALEEDYNTVQAMVDLENFTDYWLGLRHVHRDEPNFRLYPEYRFDAYLVESMERETRTFIQGLWQGGGCFLQP